MSSNVTCLSNNPADIGDFPSIISDFLQWLENEKGLRLCSAYKPQYEWYVPAHFNAITLLKEFFESQSSTLAGVGNLIKPAQLAV